MNSEGSTGRSPAFRDGDPRRSRDHPVTLLLCYPVTTKDEKRTAKGDQRKANSDERKANSERRTATRNQNDAVPGVSLYFDIVAIITVTFIRSVFYYQSIAFLWIRFYFSIPYHREKVFFCLTGKFQSDPETKYLKFSLVFRKKFRILCNYRRYHRHEHSERVLNRQGNLPG